MHEMRSRALGALYGLAIGDALGMPGQSLPRAEIVARYGPLVSEFCPGPDGHPLAAGLPAGSVTDDTEQAVLLARLVVAGGGEVDAADLARDLLAWEESMRVRGSLDLLGPSTGRPWPRWQRAPAWPRRAGPGSPTARRCGSPPWASPPPPATPACWRTAWSRPAG